jgi:D-arabinose 1-dehydrogenase-like Zn-dependent alcohol dehydrogenase
MERFGEPLKVHNDWPDPECGPRDAVLELEACGICRSDHTLWNGGMEWMGIVPALPCEMLRIVESKKLAPQDMVGDTVALEQAGDVLASMAGYETVAMSVITEF